MKSLIRIFVLLFLLCSCGEDLEKNYYNSGKLKNEYELKDGKRNGFMKEYYENGNLMRYSSWKNDRLDGKSVGFYENGQKTFTLFYSKGKRINTGHFYTEEGRIKEIHHYEGGHLLDIEKYAEDGRRIKQNVPLFYLNKDTIQLNSELIFTMRLGNITKEEYKQGAELIIASEVTKYGDPLDTIALYKSDSNYFEYHFKASKIGKGYIKGCLQYKIPIDTLPGAIYNDRYGFIQPYWVND